MKRTICFDFGNTRLKYAVFENDVFKEEAVLENDKPETISALLKKFKPQKTILSSVVEHNIEIEKILSEETSFHKLSHLTKINFTTPVGKPETIGADRLALAAAAENTEAILDIPGRGIKLAGGDDRKSARDAVACSVRTAVEEIESAAIRRRA